MPMMSDSFMIRSSSPSILTSVPDHLPNSTLSPDLSPMGWSLPSSPLAPGPAATNWPVCGFSAAVSGMMMPPLVLSSSSSRLTTTRSWSGRNFMISLLKCLNPRCVGFEVLALKGHECQNYQRWDKGSALCLSSAMHTRRLLDNDGECRQRHEQQHQQEEKVGEGQCRPW